MLVILFQVLGVLQKSEVEEQIIIGGTDHQKYKLKTRHKI